MDARAFGEAREAVIREEQRAYKEKSDTMIQQLNHDMDQLKLSLHVWLAGKLEDLFLSVLHPFNFCGQHFYKCIDSRRMRSYLPIRLSWMLEVRRLTCPLDHWKSDSPARLH
jgi:hypothetical protein